MKLLTRARQGRNESDGALRVVNLVIEQMLIRQLSGTEAESSDWDFAWTRCNAFDEPTSALTLKC